MNQRLCNCLNHLSSEIERAVKMPFNYCGTKRPHEALLDLYIDKTMNIVERRRDPAIAGDNGTPPLFIFESYPDSWIASGDCVWLLVCLGQAPAKK